MNTESTTCPCIDCAGASCTCGCQSAAAANQATCQCGCQEGKRCQCASA